jgi:putative phage-type endonuclease
MEQRSPEWFAARLGKVTASRVADIVAKGRSGGLSVLRESYMDELIAERLTVRRVDGYVSDAMRWGVDNECSARSLYEFLRDVDVTEVWFVDHPSIAMSGASPDGLVGNAGLIEIKCPNSSTHLATIRRDSVPEKYITQIHWQAACTGRQWCDFVSYDPRVEAKFQMFIKRVKIDADVVAKLESAVATFIAEIETQIEWLNRLEEAA